MRRERFAEVIAGPADVMGLDLDPGLAERMAEDTGYRDALPLLAFTLERLHARCAADNRLTMAAYEELGGVTGAISRIADAILEETGFAGLQADDPKLQALRRAMFRMVRVGEDGQFTRQSASLTDMPEAAQPVLEEMIEQRLLVRDRQDGGPVVTVAHEALLRTWPTLVRWLEEDRGALALRSQIEFAASEWQASGRASSRAWSDDRILEAVAAIARSGVVLGDVRDPQTVNAFLGPVDQDVLEVLPGLDERDEETSGSGTYGDTWALPLGHQARAATGVRLAILGDRRKGVGLREDGLPDIDWVEVPGGTVGIEIRKDWRDPNSQIEEVLQRQVGGFRMARYPVTLIQFRAFLEACHRDGAWHLPPGFPATLPPEYASPKPRTRHPNHPVECVNWLDAQAFCHWLRSSVGEAVRLPSEEEWQLAATGGDAERVYPWGAAWDPAAEPWRANTRESELGGATAVGMYPAGMAPCGALDMGGTLCEWCLNVFDSPDNTAFSTESLDRVLRGGAWSGYRGAARAGFRVSGGPNNRDDSVGFRVVVSSPSSGRSQLGRRHEMFTGLTNEGSRINAPGIYPEESDVAGAAQQGPHAA